VTTCSNTTPFIALCSIGRLDLLPAIFGTIHVPPSVVHECAAGGLIAVPSLASLDWVVVHPTPSGQLAGAWDLDAGEKDSILLSLALHADMILLDEKLGRNPAEHHGLRVSGTLGVQIRAKKVA
jgi:predicted nucleic acid-binding protein